MNNQELLRYVENKFVKTKPSAFRVGDTVRVHVKIIEGDSARIQVFEGTVISFKGHSGARTFTVRKLSFGVGVERCFPLYSPTIEKITVVRSGQIRRSKLYYLRDRIGRASKLEEKEGFITPAKVASEVPSSTIPKPAAPSTDELVSTPEK